MNLIRVGRRRINLDYMIDDEEGDGSPETAAIPEGGIRVTLRRGRSFILTGPDAEDYRRQVEPFVLRPSDPASAGPFARNVAAHLAPRPLPAEGERPDGGEAEAGGGHGS